MEASLKKNIKNITTMQKISVMKIVEGFKFKSFFSPIDWFYTNYGSGFVSFCLYYLFRGCFHTYTPDSMKLILDGNSKKGVCVELNR